jgi:hypothetical protein
MFDSGHDIPLRKSKIKEKNKKRIIPVSRLGMNTEIVIEKKMVANKNGIISPIRSPELPM